VPGDFEQVQSEAYVRHDMAPAVAGPIPTSLPEPSRPREPVPIWLDVLRATPSRARSSGASHSVRWDWAGGRALYTNRGRDAEHIEPWGVSLRSGHTMAISWLPGETVYTVEVYLRDELVA
jgi:hypothetical protein